MTLSGAVRFPGVYEVPFGRPLRDLVADAGGATGELQAFLVGGLFGTWIGAAEAAGARLSTEGLAPFEAFPGARAIVALPAEACGVAETARAARYLAAESAGQCGPCVHGLAAIADGLEALASRPREADTALLRRRLALIVGRGACRHPDGAVGLVSSALRVFAPEFERHANGRPCTGRLKGALVLPALPREQRR